jgi:hypothetical protein
MKASIFVLALAAAGASSVVAGPFTQLCDTGVSNCATESPVTTQGVTDSNFSVTAAPAGVTSPSAVTFFTGGYFQSGANPLGTTTASWIGTKTGGSVTQAVGTYTYQEAITASVTGPVTISGSWGTDNCGTLAWGTGSGTAVSSGSGLTIGGGANASTCTSPFSAFESLSAFSFNETVNAGTTYFLDFNVYNSAGPTALMVDSLAATCAVGAVCGGGTGTGTPEPSSVLLTLTGITLLGLGIRRRMATQGARS